LGIIDDEVAAVRTDLLCIRSQRCGDSTSRTITIGDYHRATSSVTILLQLPLYCLGIVVREGTDWDSMHHCAFDAPPHYRIDTCIHIDNALVSPQHEKEIPKEMKRRRCEERLFAALQLSEGCTQGASFVWFCQRGRHTGRDLCPGLQHPAGVLQP
jgi:hypothetical protein